MRTFHSFLPHRFAVGRVVLGAILGLLASSTLNVEGRTQADAQSTFAGSPGTPARIKEAVDDQKRVILRGNTPPLARRKYEHGLAPDDLPMKRMLLVLKRQPEQEAALGQLLQAQQDKSSPLYHRWLTPQEFGRRFGAADADIQKITGWLASEGFEMDHVSNGRDVIEFSGVAGLVRHAFHTEIHRYEVKGEMHWSNASDPEIPAALAPVVAGVASLNNFPRWPLYHRLGAFRRSRMTGKITPLFTYTPSSKTYYALGPTDFATIYDVSPLWSAGIDGTGETIALVEDSNINPQDAADFRAMFGLPANPVQIVLDGADPGIEPFTEAEADLDAEWAGGVAKGATIDLVVSEDTEATAGVDLSAVYVVDNNLAPVMSESFGSCEAFLGTTGNQFYSSLWEQGAAEGITIVVAAGDTGSAGCDFLGSSAAQYGLAVSGIASTPFDVAVGGTDFNDAGNLSQYWNSTNAWPTQLSAKSYIPEQTWNDSCAASGNPNNCTTVNPEGLDVAAGGGGPSNCSNLNSFFCVSGYPKPAWQAGAGVPADSVRDIPDVALFAADGSSGSGSFYVFCQMDANSGEKGNASSCDLNAPFLDFQGGGGTSFSAPIFAGIMAMVVQKTGERQGDANFALYPLAAETGASCASISTGSGNSACIFNDVVAGNNSVACSAGFPNCSDTHLDFTSYGILVNPADDTSPAWTTKPGYDQPTGLGSVNAANLVSHWTSASFQRTTTTLSLSTSPPTSPISLNHGQPVNVGVQVAPASGSGTPTGAVSVIARTSGVSTTGTTGIASFALSNGAASGTTTHLPGGTYNVTARYGGDGTFGGSESAPPISVTVSPEASSTHVHVYNGFFPISFTATNALYGNFYLRVDVTNSSNGLCTIDLLTFTYGCPTGQVKISASGQPVPDQNGNSSGVYALNASGYTEDQIPPLAPGTYSLAAGYSGDSSYLPSASAVTLTIAKGPTYIYLYPQPAGGQSVQLVAYINTISAGAEPTGTVKFLNGNTPLAGTVTYQGAAYSRSMGFAAYLQAMLTTLLTAPESVTVQYSGDANYAASSSPAITVLAPDFRLTANPPSVTIASPGQSAASSISIGDENGFTGAVNVTCSMPSNLTEASCLLNPTSVGGNGSVALLISTTAPRASSVFPMPAGPDPAGIFLVLAACLLVALAARRTRKIAPWAAAAALLALALASCGGGGSSGGGPGGNGGGSSVPGTPAGTYTLTVTGTSGSVTHSIALTLTVQ